MDRKLVLEAALTLPPDERANVVKDIWDSLLSDPQAIKLTDAQERELERCWQAYLGNPKAGDDWQTVKARILRRQA